MSVYTGEPSQGGLIGGVISYLLTKTYTSSLEGHGIDILSFVGDPFHANWFGAATTVGDVIGTFGATVNNLVHGNHVEAFRLAKGILTSVLISGGHGDVAALLHY